MNRKVSEFVPAGELARQAEWMDRVRELNAAPGRTRLAMVDTYGCQQNEADGERLLGMLAAMGYGVTDDPFLADVVAVNTCAVREHAEMRVFGNVGHLTHTKRANPGQIIVFCGCMAQEPEAVEKVRKSYPHVDLLFGPQAIWRFPELLYSALTRKGRIFEPYGGDAIAEGLPVMRRVRHRAWVPIMYGCDNFCSYCIVPYVRGRERSRGVTDIVREAEELIGDGCREITLLGQNVNSYGGEGGFPALLRKLSEIPGDFLIRFMTSHPKDATDELFDVMAASPKIARQLHLPFQSGSDRVLQAMNRGYTAEGYLSLIGAARGRMPDITLTSDVIVGFPGETEEDFEDTLRLMERARFDALFTFIYSKRSGTPAASFSDGATAEEKGVRFKRLLDIQNAISKERHGAYVGKTMRVLIDGADEDKTHTLSARTNGNRLVHLDGDASLIGSFADVAITKSSSWALFGKLNREGGQADG